MGFANGHFTTDSGAASSGASAAFASNGFQNFVATDYLTAVNGSPSSSQFRSDITNRASIPNLGNDLFPKMGMDRMTLQSLTEVQSEVGPAGQRVYKLTADSKDQLRFVGNWIFNASAFGTYVASSSLTTDYVEIVFYGTGLNLLVENSSPAPTYDARASVDGAAEGSNLYLTGASGVLTNKGYNPNTVLPVTSGLTLGLHTVKIRNAALFGNLYGLEVLTQATALKVPTGTALIDGTSVSHSAAEDIAYNSTFESGALGTRGGRVVAYLKSSGAIGKVVTPANPAQANLTSADHTNEEVARVYYPREFGSNRADDFSTLDSSSSARSYTLDDGTTGLYGLATAFNIGNTNGLFTVSNGSSITFTFVGTGLDIKVQDTATGTDTQSATIDGTGIGNFDTAGSTSTRIMKVVSGLPYGTHTFTITRVSGSNYSRTIHAFIVYQPKKPTLPSGAIELLDYNVMATFAANATAGADTISTGVLRKSVMRELAYVNGTGGSADWAMDLATGAGLYIGGNVTYSNRQNAYMEYTFFGTGFDFRAYTTSGLSANITVSLNGTTLTAANFPSASFSTYGTGVAFNSATGVFDQNDGGNTTGIGFVTSGLPLAKYTVRFNNNSAGSYLAINAFDIITPVHAHKASHPVSVGNTMAVGSQSLLDTRALTPIKNAIGGDKHISYVKGISSGPTTASTSFVPIPDMLLPFYASGNKAVEVSFSGSIGTTSGSQWECAVHVDGVEAFKTLLQSNSGGYDTPSFSVPLYLSPGFHFIQMYWRSISGSTVSALTTHRILSAEEN